MKGITILDLKTMNLMEASNMLSSDNGSFFRVRNMPPYENY